MAAASVSAFAGWNGSVVRCGKLRSRAGGEVDSNLRCHGKFRVANRTQNLRTFQRGNPEYVSNTSPDRERCGVAELHVLTVPSNGDRWMRRTSLEILLPPFPFQSIRKPVCLGELMSR